MDLELRHLRLVCAVAETGSVTKAAAALGLAHAALTAQLRRIEHRLGGPLFERDRRGARPTALGELVLARAKVLMTAVDGLMDDASRLADAGEAITRFRIGATNGPIVGGLVPRLAAAYPDALVTTHTAWATDELAAMVLADKLDYALVGVCGDAMPSVSGLTWHPVCVDAVWVLLSDRHPLAGRTEIELAELAGERWANAPGDGCFLDCFAAACARAGFTPRQILETEPSACADLVVTGAAVLLAQGMSRPIPGAALIPLAGTPLRWRHLLGWRPGSAAASVAPEVFAHAVAAYRETIDRRPNYAGWLRDHPAFGAAS
ncbi:LysR family transcriptional regulator [Actinomycetes bacterium KLBMP 9797]